MYLWLPKLWTLDPVQEHAVVPRAACAPKARDFNWHNVIGVWSAIPLAIVVAGAVPISYPWASNLVYRLVGEHRRRPRCRPRGPAGRRTGGLSAPARRAYVTSTVSMRRGRSAQAQIPELAHDDDRARRRPQRAGRDHGRRRLRRPAAEARHAHVRPRHRPNREGGKVREPQSPAGACVRGCASRTPARSTG